MRRLMTRATAVVAAVVAAGALGVSAADAATQAPHPARTSPLTAARPQAVPGAKLWLQRYNGPGNGSDAARSVAVSPDGGKVFVTGESKGATPGTDPSDYLTVAYNAATGTQLWTARYKGPGTYDDAQAVTVSPDGAAVYVTGSSEQGSGQFGDYATVAYRASDGTQVWVARFNGPANDGDYATALSVARDGTQVFVTGRSRGADNRISFATVAYRASDGSQLWVGWYAQGNRGVSNAIVSPGGNRVFVTGYVQSKLGTAEYGTVAYNATTGAQLWARTYAGQGATSIAASPDRTTVYVTGESHFNSGARLWARFYGSRRRIDGASSVAVSPGGRVVVTGDQPRLRLLRHGCLQPRRRPAVGPALQHPRHPPAAGRQRLRPCGGRSRQRQGVRHRGQLGRQRHRLRLRHHRLQHPHRRSGVAQAVQRPGE